MTALQTCEKKIKVSAAKYKISRKRNSADRLDLGEQLERYHVLHAHHSPAHKGLGSFEKDLEALKPGIPLRTLQRIRREYLAHLARIQRKKFPPNGGNSRKKSTVTELKPETQPSSSGQPIDHLDKALADITHKKNDFKQTQKFRLVLVLSYQEALEFRDLRIRASKLLRTTGDKATILEALKYVDHSAQKATAA